MPLLRVAMLLRPSISHSVPTVSAAAAAAVAAAAAAATTTTATATARRHFHASAASRHPYKDSQDRESLKPDRQEGTASGRTGDVVEHEDAAFNPRRTDPESEKKAAGEDGNPLDVSPASPDVSKPQGNEGEVGRKTGAGKHTKSTDKSSGGGSAPKNMGVKNK